MVFNNKHQQLQSLIAKAEVGDAQAMNELGVIYQQGILVQQDYARAFSYYEKAAAKGSMLALYNLGVMHYKGLGTAKDLQKAINYYQQAAQQNYRNAMMNLAIIAQNDLHDDCLAVSWFEKLIALDYTPAFIDLAQLYLYSQQITDKRDEAFKLLIKAYPENKQKAAYLLACCYYDGVGIEQDKVKTMQLLYEAAENAYAPAIYQLGIFAETGEMGVQDLQVAMQCFQEALRLGYAEAQQALERLNSK